VDFGGLLILGLFAVVYYIFKYWQWVLIIGIICLICYLYIKNKSRAKFARTVRCATAFNTPFQIDSNQPVSKSRDELAQTAPNATAFNTPFQIDSNQPVSKSRDELAQTASNVAASKTLFQIDSNQQVSKSRNEFACSAPNARASKKLFQINNNQAVSKGDKFERYVVDKFDENKFTIVEWTTDTTRKHHRYVEADTRPDLLIRYNLTGEEFYVECKYRSYFYENKFQWSTPEQMNRYLRFAYKQNKPFFVVLGLGGTPDRPEKIFCIPIQEAKYPALYSSVLTKFSHEAGKDFVWNGHILN